MNPSSDFLAPETTRPTSWRTIVGICLLWGAAFGCLEAAYFTRVNGVFPLGPGHVLLAAALTVQTAVMALLAAVAAAGIRRGWRRLPASLPLVAGPGALLTLLAVSHYRDRMLRYSARQTQDVMITLLLVAAMVLALGAIAWWISRRRPDRAEKLLLALGVAGLAGGATWLGTARSPFVDTAPPETVTAEEVGPLPDTGLRVLIVGLDGGTWKVLDPMIEAGELPALASLTSRGTTADLQSIVPTYSPIIWTTVATGKEAAKHRIFSHVFTRMPLGLPSVPHGPTRIKHLTKIMKYNVRAGHGMGVMPIGIYGAHNRRALTLWDVLTDFDLPTVSLSWFVTHPALPLLGLQVSDEFYLMKDQTDLLQQAVHPDSLAPLLEAAIVPEDELPGERLSQLVDGTGLDAEGLASLKERYPRIGPLARGMARDLTTMALVDEGFRRVPDWRLGMVYYRAMDNAHHLAWQFRGLPDEELDRFPERRFRTTVDAAYRFSDELLAATLEPADESTVVIVLSDHGWEDRQWGHKRKPDGFAILAGGPVIASATRGTISVHDVAPTVLALLGIPVPDDMDGRVAEEFIEPSFWKEHPVRTVPSYERPLSYEEGSGPKATDDKVLEQLRALGYVGQ